MNQRSKAQDEETALRQLRAIYRRADRKAKAQRPVIHPLMTSAEVCSLFGFQRETLRRRMECGKLPPPCNKPLSAPTNPILKAMWQRDHRRWNRRVMEAISWGIMPPVIHTFQCPQDWIDFLTDHKEFA